MSFHFPWAFILLIFLPWFYLRKKGEFSAINFGSVSLLKPNVQSVKLKYMETILKILRFLSLFLIICALARPRTSKENVWEETEGIDILLVLDVSSSMLAEDFTINRKPYSRLEVVKSVVGEFISEREQDRIGIVMFAGEPMTLCPLTTDYGVLNEFLDHAKIGVLPDGTAIGDSMAFGINRLKNAKGKSKVIILLTDGANNAGQLDPLLSADLAASKNIKVYTIGVGRKGKVPMPTMDPFRGKQYVLVEMRIDEDLLKQIAKKTGGQFFRATSTEGLREIYNDIDKMEKTKAKTSKTVEYNEKFKWFLIPGMILLLIEIILTNTIFLRVP
jgi:Ca-activated chloride channel family protein